MVFNTIKYLIDNKLENQMISQIKSYDDIVKNTDIKNIVNCGNLIGCSNGLEIKSQSLQNIFSQYKLTSNSDGDMNHLNNFIKKMTNNEIQNMITELPDYLMYVIINTVLFKAKWAKIKTELGFPNSYINPFDSGDTLTYNNSKIMVSDGCFDYYETDSMQLLSLKLENCDNLNVVFILGYDNHKHTIDSIHTCMKSKKETKIKVYLPKFKMEMTNDKETLLQQFNESLPQSTLFVNIYQKVCFEIDENGAKGAAATFASMSLGMKSQPDKVFDARGKMLNFLVYNKDIPPLFMGTYKS